MRFGFVTCVQLGLSCMEAIYELQGRLDLVLTLPDTMAVRKSGRVHLDAFCARQGIPLVKIPHINSPEALATLREARLDWLFIIGWSQIANGEVLATAGQGVLGMHPTLLPVGRGRAAIPWAILLGLPSTGVTLFKLDTGVDTGPIAGQVTIPLDGGTTSAGLYEQVAAAHAQLMRDCYPRLADGTIRFTVQDESRATCWPGRTPADGLIDPEGSVADAERLVRAATRPYPGAFFHRGGRKVIVWSARATDREPEGPSLAFRDGFLELLAFDVDPA
jgi:methionyl-tRNA formyltransferase